MGIRVWGIIYGLGRLGLVGRRVGHRVGKRAGGWTRLVGGWFGGTSYLDFGSGLSIIIESPKLPITHTHTHIYIYSTIVLQLAIE